MLVSDASVQKSKHSGFAWVISQDDLVLWKGVGLAPGMADDIYSGRAEAFGLLAGLTFLKHYIASYGTTSFMEAPLQCFCDNLGVITNVTALLTPTILRPNEMTRDDCNLYMAISEMAIQCAPMQPMLLHVKGHQDQHPHHLLTVSEQNNVDCDK